MSSRRTLTGGSFFAFAILSSCGTPEDNAVQLNKAPEQKTVGERNQSEDSSLGLVVDSFTKENWIYVDSKGNVPTSSRSTSWPVKPYRPEGYDVFMGALRSLNVDVPNNTFMRQEGRKCTGMLVSEPTQAGASTFNIFILTAAHCFEEANPIGFMTQKISNSQKFVSTPFTAQVTQESLSSGRYLRQFFADSSKNENYIGKTVERSLNGDVARVLIEAGVSAEQVQRRSAVPLCNREYSSYSPDLVQRSGNRFRALIGRDVTYAFGGAKSYIKRMYSGASNSNDVGVYNRNANVTNFINSWAKEYTRGGASTEFYSWTAGKSMELDAGDSGLPVIEGTQTGSGFEFGPIVSKFECVSGVVTRAHWEMLSGRVGDTASGLNTAIIQRVWTNAANFWEKASPL